MLSENDYQKAADSIGCKVAAVKAFAVVESSGSGFLNDGRPKVQFEPHVMFRRVKSKFGDKFAQMMAEQFPNQISRGYGSYLPLIREHEEMGIAAENIDRDCALESASWGAFQIMGYHWKYLGYEKLQDFVNAMYRSEADQLDAFVRFIKRDSRLVRALKDLDWEVAARIYNGPAYSKFNYHIKMQEAFNRFNGEILQ